MTMRTASIPSKGGAADEPLRPAVHRQFRLMPVPLQRDPEWNARIASWARW